jgi:hypothetical protein
MSSLQWLSEFITAECGSRQLGFKVDSDRINRHYRKNHDKVFHRKSNDSQGVGKADKNRSLRISGDNFLPRLSISIEALNNGVRVVVTLLSLKSSLKSPLK